MDEKQLKYVTQHIEITIEKKVNGKIDKLQKTVDNRFDAHEKKMSQVYDAYNTASNLGKVLMWLSKVVLAIGILSLSFISFIKFIKK